MSKKAQKKGETYDEPPEEYSVNKYRPATNMIITSIKSKSHRIFKRLFIC